MPKYKVLIPFFKLSDKHNYNIGDTIELSKEDALLLVQENRIVLNDPSDGTDGIVTRKTPEQAEKEIKKANKK
jgi:hypothetical protein